MPKKVVLTGGTGFVGANLARRLLSLGHEVHLFVRPEYSRWRIEEIASDVHLHELSLLDEERLRSALEAVRPEWIFHLAAYGNYSWQSDQEQILQTNLLSTVRLLECARAVGFECFVNTGSSSEYGFKTRAPSEREWLEPNSYYAVSKASATLYCRYVANAFKLQVPTLRLYSVYGPYEDPARLVPRAICAGLQKQYPPLANPAIARDFVYTEDVNDAFLLAATVPHPEYGSIYNVGSGVQTTLRELVDLSRVVFDLSAEPPWGSMPDRAWDTTVWVADSALLQNTLGWRPRHTLEEGFRLTAQWFQERAPRSVYGLG